MGKCNQLFKNRITQCLTDAKLQYGWLLHIPEREEILLNYEHMDRGTLAHATGNPRNKKVRSIISLNPMYASDYSAEYSEFVIPHEVAHIICFRNELDDAHGDAWKEVCVSMGGIDTETLDIIRE